MSDTPETDDLARGNHVVPTEWAQQLERERDDAREEVNKLSGAYEDATNYYARIIELKEELDEAREALMRIEDLFIDGTDIYADRENMGLIAKTALEEIK